MKKLKKMVSEDNLTISRPSRQSSTVERQYTEPIPVDLLIDIFLRVPSKSIARFCCVSKLWANILGRPYFTELFLRKSLHHPRLLFTFLVYGKLYFFSCPQKTDANSSFVATRYRANSFNSISSSVHGMVCRQYWIKYYQRKPVVCNPITGEILTLPKVKTHVSCPALYCVYDPTYKQYKLLCVSADSHSSIRAQVLTLNTGKHQWRMIECTPHHPMFYRGISIGGVLYYLAHTTGDYMIVCFDARSEKFSFIRVNDGSMTRPSNLINYKGKLGEVHFTDSDRTSLRLWLLEQDHAGEYKWSSSIYELTLSFRDFYIVGMTAGTSDIVLSPKYLYEDPFYVFYYNVERKALRRVEIQGFQELKWLRPRVVYTFEDYVEDVKLMENL